MNIYFDIDGTLLHKNGTPAAFLVDLLRYAIEKHKCYWLTTHCRDGDSTNALSYVRRKNVPENVLAMMEMVRPTAWDTLKTEAIDMSEPFIWLDDAPMTSELEALDRAGRRDALRLINLRDSPRALLDVLQELA